MATGEDVRFGSGSLITPSYKHSRNTRRNIRLSQTADPRLRKNKHQSPEVQIIRSHKYLHLGNIKEQAKQLQWIGLTCFSLVVFVIIAVITTWSRGWFIKKRNKKCRISRSYRMMIEQLRDMNIKLISHLEHQEMEQQQNQVEQMTLHQLLAQQEHVNSENFVIIAKENQELKEILQNLNMNLLQVHEVAHQHQQQNEDHKMKEQQFHEKQEETNKQCENLARANKELKEEVQQLKSKLILLEEQQKQLDHENVQEHHLNMEESQHNNNSPGALRHCVDTPNHEGFHRRPDLLKQFGTLLNEMTQDNYHHLLAMIMALNITYRHFESIVQMIVCQAIAMPKHSAAYASLCQHLTKIKVPMEDTARTFETFQQILLKQCEKEYCKSLAGISCICDIKSVEASRLANEDELCTLLISRKCSLGIIRFIGELYKLGAVDTNNIVHILAELLRDGRNQSVEYICCLLNTVEKELTSDLTDNVMDEYFHHLELIAKEGKLSARILFILQQFVFHRKRFSPNDKSEDKGNVSREGMKESGTSFQFTSQQSQEIIGQSIIRRIPLDLEMAGKRRNEKRKREDDEGSSEEHSIDQENPRKRRRSAIIHRVARRFSDPG